MSEMKDSRLKYLERKLQSNDDGDDRQQWERANILDALML